LTKEKNVIKNHENIFYSVGYILDRFPIVYLLCNHLIHGLSPTGKIEFLTISFIFVFSFHGNATWNATANPTNTTKVHSI